MDRGAIAAEIESGQTVLGIEFGSTRIKAVLIGADHAPIAAGSYDWENQYENGLWTYKLEDVVSGLQASYRRLKQDVLEKYDTPLQSLGALGISGMMHGYLAFDPLGRLLVPFRTWRNTTTAPAAERLTQLFQFNIPQRWSIAHLYQAILNQEPHVASIRHLTTLAGFVHAGLAGQRVLGVGEASGVFPIDSATNTYDARRLALFDALPEVQDLPWTLAEILPQVLPAGAEAGTLTESGARLLDPTGELLAGSPVCPPEGDASTGMVATNSVAERTGNVSAGTSVFAMIVLEKPLSKVYPEIDLVTTPTGKPVAMVHSNNCTSDLNAWAQVFQEFAQALGVAITPAKLFELLYQQALRGEADGGGLLAYNYLSGEHITHLEQGRPLFARTPESRFTLANFMRVNLLAALGALKIGLDILFEQEQVKIDQLLGHGGFFKTKAVGQTMMAAATNVPVRVLATAGEGGAWGIALLAAYMRRRAPAETLEDYLARQVFAGELGAPIAPDPADVAGFAAFMQRYQAGLVIERAAVDALSKPPMLEQLRQELFELHLELPKNNLVAWTSGNVSARDPGTGLVVIKPSGVRYERLRPEHMVVVDLDGHIVEGDLKPSSDTASHLYLYRHRPDVGGVVHTHSTYATAFAAVGRPIPVYLTAQADEFGGPIPCGEFALIGGEEIGQVVLAAIGNSCAVLLKNHGVITIGKDAEAAVKAAVMVEDVARTTFLALQLGQPDEIPPEAIAKLHHRYTHVYGQ